MKSNMAIGQQLDRRRWLKLAGARGILGGAAVNPIQKLMLSMFIHLRIGVGVIGLSLPLVLVFGGKIMGVSFAGSMSAYYHATRECSLPDCSLPDRPAMKNSNCQKQGSGPMRNWFVGNLFFVGAAMFLMKSFSQWENWALNVAGIAAPPSGCMAEDSCSVWTKQADGTYWRTCVDDNGHQYCQTADSNGKNVTRVACK